VIAGGATGPKAESLARLTAAGLPVPEARFLGADAYREHAARAGLEALVRDGVTPAEIRAVMRATPISAGAEVLLRTWFTGLGGGALAVRSSGTAEDLPHASFAGQHGTYFVTSADALVERVRDCWASLYSDRAVAYRDTLAASSLEVAMAVIVQRVVSAIAAGVAFTRDPVTDADDVVVEACLGLGETLVSGKVTPDRFSFARDGLALLAADHGHKCVRVDLDPAGGVTQRSVPADEAAAPAIDEAVAREVARLSLAAEDLFGRAVDVEWAFDGELVWLLQARPITTIAKPAGRESAVDGGPGEPPIIWSNVNTGEILPDVATPMTWTVIYHHAEQLIGGMLGAFGLKLDAQKAIGLVGGRFYFNLTLLRDAFVHLPGVDVDVVLGGMHDYINLPSSPAQRASLWTRVRGIVRTATVLPGYVASHSPKRSVRFAAMMRSHAERATRELPGVADVGGAYRIFRSLIEDFARFNDALAFMGVAMFGFGVLGGLTKRWLGDETGALANRLVTGRGDVASADAGHEMWRLSALAKGARSVSSAVLVGSGWADVRERLEVSARGGDADAAGFLAAWDAFMTEHGHHRRGELEFANASWAERPDYVLGIVRSYLAEDRDIDPMAAYAERAADADRAAVEALARLRGLRRVVFKRVLAWGRSSAQTRENVKSEAVRWLVAIRLSLLAIGTKLAEAGVLDRADDIFFIEYDQLPALVGGDPRDWRSLVAGRRTEHERLEKLSPPPVVLGTWDESAGPWFTGEAAKTLTGISVSAGVARGPARVFLSADTDEPVLPGEILVAPFTDPGWTPYFVPAAGIVMDMGGLLSHGSIIAREYGIPAVVNVGPATQIIRTGQIIEVDGEKGEVRILG
jgi:phosphohistidine swiveling domain-containing protein